MVPLLEPSVKPTFSATRDKVGVLLFDYFCLKWVSFCLQLNGLDPAQWLRETLEKLPTCPNSQIDSLLPFMPLRPEPLPHTAS